MRRGDRAGIRATRPLPTNRDAEAPSVDASPDLDRGLGELLDDDRRTRAREVRRDAEFQRYALEDSATLAGLLRDLAEHEAAVVLEHVGGRVAGRIVGLGPDCVVLHARGAEFRAVVSLVDVVTVATEAGWKPPAARGHRDVPSELRLREVLADAAEQRVEVRVHVRDRDGALGGRVRAVGEDLVTVAGRAARDACTFVPLQRVVRVDLMD